MRCQKIGVGKGLHRALPPAVLRMGRRQMRTRVSCLEVAGIRMLRTVSTREDGKGVSSVADRPPRGAPGVDWWFARVVTKSTWRRPAVCQGSAFAQCVDQGRVFRHAIGAARHSVVNTWITTVLLLRNLVVSQDWVLSAVSWSEAFPSTCQLESLVQRLLCAWIHQVIGISERRCERVWSLLMRRPCGQGICGAHRS